ncbi:MAG: HyaD/HybD family hydrogenase maturation endopeptidase [Gammaproteobacteria bacterium]|jgi:hydrogenase maturation protease|nr:HyaD/HybD family hydrogenase maturation endopeptidase [Gammaproteobacteria bacterium]
MRVLVMGIGNTLLTDEGAGVHVLEYLREHHPDLPDVEYLDGGTLSFTLAGPIEDADAWIVIDAAQLQADPGAIRHFVGTEMDHFLGTTKRSVHEVGLVDLMDIARLTGHLPERRALVGIQPAEMGWGDKPSPRVAAAIPAAAARVLEVLHSWGTA